MAQEYNPIVRTFGRFRAALVRVGVPRRNVRPEARLEELIPVPARRQVWRQLWQEGIPVPPLQLSPAAQWLGLIGVAAGAVLLALGLWRWEALLAAFPLGVAAFWASRPWAVHLPHGRLTTVGETVLAMTSVREHRRCGYRWTRNEIAFKVRFIIAESLGLPLVAVRPDTTFAELE